MARAKQKDKTQQQYAERKSLLKGDAQGVMQVRVFSLKNGLQVYEKVLMIHVKSSKYDLLIMEDYLPIIGEIDGNVIVTWADNEMILTGIKGFFCHEHNSFFLLLKESSNVG